MILRTKIPASDLFKPTLGRVTDYTISAVVQIAKTFASVGDFTGDFAPGDFIGIKDSTGNNGVYTLSLVSLVLGSTIFTTVESIPDGTADGTLYWTADPDPDVDEVHIDHPISASTFGQFALLYIHESYSNTGYGGGIDTVISGTPLAPVVDSGGSFNGTNFTAINTGGNARFVDGGDWNATGTTTLGDSQQDLFTDSNVACGDIVTGDLGGKIFFYDCTAQHGNITVNGDMAQFAVGTDIVSGSGDVTINGSVTASLTEVGNTQVIRDLIINGDLGGAILIYESDFSARNITVSGTVASLVDNGGIIRCTRRMTVMSDVNSLGTSGGGEIHAAIMRLGSIGNAVGDSGSPVLLDVGIMLVGARNFGACDNIANGVPTIS